jgi:hypothetical protein
MILFGANERKRFKLRIDDRFTADRFARSRE